MSTVPQLIRKFDSLENSSPIPGEQFWTYRHCNLEWGKPVKFGFQRWYYFCWSLLVWTQEKWRKFGSLQNKTPSIMENEKSWLAQLQFVETTLFDRKKSWFTFSLPDDGADLSSTRCGRFTSRFICFAFILVFREKKDSTIFSPAFKFFSLALKKVLQGHLLCNYVPNLIWRRRFFLPKISYFSNNFSAPPFFCLYDASFFINK